MNKQAEEAIKLAFDHLSKNDSRTNQNACDFYTEFGDYESAMKYLALSCVGEQAGSDFESQATEVLEKCGCYGEVNGIVGKFLYLHYVSMMHRCFRMNDPHGEILLGLIPACSVMSDSFDHLIREPHPDAAILWHLAASFAHVPDRSNIAQHLFDYAIRALTNRGELFRTICMSVQGEMIALGLEQKLPGEQKEWRKKANHYLNKILPDYVQSVKHNPFPVKPDDFSSFTHLEFLYRLADAVVY